MEFKILTLIIFCFHGALCENSNLNLAFKPSFSMGTATSAYQVEGAWNVSGKGVSVWDWATHNTPIAADRSNGDIACDSYHKIDEDIRIMKELGVNHYRFSLSWTRILGGGGYRNKVNPEGIAYYNELIDKLLANKIEPWVTIHHFDFPYSSHVIGGWLQEEIAQQLADFADLVFKTYGDRVKVWMSINEPYNMCVSGTGIVGPSRPLGIVEYICSRNMLRAHALIKDIYNKKYRATQKGKLSMAFSMQGLIPASDSAEDIAATKRVADFMWGWFVHPCIFGDYPKIMKDQIERYSLAQGFVRSRMPPLSCKERNMLKNSIDYIGLNNYDTWLVQANSTISQNPSFQNDLGANIITDPGWNMSTSLQMRAKGLGIIIDYIRKNYGNIEILITEQGMPDKPDNVNDVDRHNYIVLSLRQVLKSISQGANINGYTFWSLMDNFEWSFGYTARYGLYHVDFNNPSRPRTAKLSAKTFATAAKQKSLTGLTETF